MTITVVATFMLPLLAMNPKPTYASLDSFRRAPRLEQTGLSLCNEKELRIFVAYSSIHDPAPAEPALDAIGSRVRSNPLAKTVNFHSKRGSTCKSRSITGWQRAGGGKAEAAEWLRLVKTGLQNNVQGGAISSSDDSCQRCRGAQWPEWLRLFKAGARNPRMRRQMIPPDTRPLRMIVQSTQ
jgi:hypothetical protein